MRRPPASVIAAAVLAAVVLAGCGAQGIASPTPKTIIGTAPSAPTFPIVAAYHLKGDKQKGKSVFASAGCGSCHTLGAAHSSGTVGPNLDALGPDYRAVTAQVTNGGAQMPAFKQRLTTKQIADVAAFVVAATGGKAP